MVVPSCMKVVKLKPHRKYAPISRLAHEVGWKYKGIIDAMEFPGRQKIYVSKKWGFTKFDREEYEEMRKTGRLLSDGATAKYVSEHGPLSKWCKIQAELAGC